MIKNKHNFGLSIIRYIKKRTSGEDNHPELNTFIVIKYEYNPLNLIIINYINSLIDYVHLKSLGDLNEIF